MRQEQRDHKHRKEGQVLGIEERMRVKARMQEKQQRCGDRRQPRAEEPEGEQVRKESTG